MTEVLLQFFYYYFVPDLRYHYKNLSAADRNRINKTLLSGPMLLDNSTKEGAIFDTTIFSNVYLF